MSDLIEKWVRGALEFASIGDIPAPQFKNRHVAAAYARYEAWALHRLRRGEPVPPRFHEQLAREVVLLQVFDAAWSEPDGFVYVIGAKREADFVRLDHVKIGYSFDPDTRARQLQTGCHFPIDVYRSVPGTPALERTVHDLLREHRAQGEWFRYGHHIEEVTDSLWRVAAAWGAERYGEDR